MSETHCTNGLTFPNEGSIVTWLDTVDILLEVVEPHDDAKINCGHVTASKPAKGVLQGAKAFMLDVLSGKEEVRDRFEKRGEMCVEYVQEGMRFSLICPERLVEEARHRVGNARTPSSHTTENTRDGQ